MGMTFNVGGRIVSENELLAQKQYSKPKAESAAPKLFHKGWVVEGYAPGRIAEAEADAKRQRQPWDLARWVKKQKPARVRARPFEVRSAAEQLAQLAARDGWELVKLVELSEGSIPFDDPFDTRGQS